MTDQELEQFRLPDGRLPVRLNGPRSAWYKRRRGEGEVLYPLATVRHFHKRPRLTPEELREVALKRVEFIKSRKPDHYAIAGGKGGRQKGINYERKHAKDNPR